MPAIEHTALSCGERAPSSRQIRPRRGHFSAPQGTPDHHKTYRGLTLRGRRAHAGRATFPAADLHRHSGIQRFCATPVNAPKIGGCAASADLGERQECRTPATPESLAAGHAGYIRHPSTAYSHAADRRVISAVRSASFSPGCPATPGRARQPCIVGNGSDPVELRVEATILAHPGASSSGIEGLVRLDGVRPGGDGESLARALFADCIPGMEVQSADLFTHHGARPRPLSSGMTLLLPLFPRGRAAVLFCTEVGS